MHDTDKVNDDHRLFVKSGMLRVQSSDHLDPLEKETLANMTRDGLRDTQFVKSEPIDRERARIMGWEDKILDFEMPHQSSSSEGNYEAVLDSLAGFVRCSAACVHYLKNAAAKGVEFCFGREGGAFDSFVEESTSQPGKKRVSGLKTKDGKIHRADTVVVAGEFPSSRYTCNLADPLSKYQLGPFQRRFFLSLAIISSHQLAVWRHLRLTKPTRNFGRNTLRNDFPP